MSQPKIYGQEEQDPLGMPLKSVEQLLEIFVKAERKREDWLMGVEYEIFGQIDGLRSPIPYHGDVSITALFKHLVVETARKSDPFKPVMEDDYIVALSAQGATIALEPGGQLEIAASPQATLKDVILSLSDTVKDIEGAGRDLGISLFALGVHPWATQKDMAEVEKARYNIMREYMKKTAGLGLDMMTRSCAIQINLDYENELDMVEKTRLGAALVPFHSLLCSSVAFVDKKPARHAIERGHIWRMTDKDRTGIPGAIFHRNFGYQMWIDQALDIPMYFIRRKGNYVNVAGASFRHFMAHGLRDFQPTVRDFVDHLTTVFTEVRLKPFLELRSADSLPLPFANALFGLTWALFYDDNANMRARAIFHDLTHQELHDLHYACIDRGRKAKFRGEPVFLIIERLLAIADEALNRLSIRQNEPALKDLLAPFTQIAAKSETIADWIRIHFTPLTETNLPKLCKSFDPSKNPLKT